MSFLQYMTAKSMKKTEKETRRKKNKETSQLKELEVNSKKM